MRHEIGREQALEKFWNKTSDPAPFSGHSHGVGLFSRQKIAHDFQ
jgi:hypothetical protein